MNSNRPGRGDWRDSDWMPNRPTRGRGTWAGDWALSNADSAENYAGRGPKDYRRSDDRIREDVCDRFTDDPAVDASEIAVRVENGDVTLMGTVASREQKRRAEDLVERVTGVRDVSNQLRVNRADTTTTTTSASGQTTGRTRGGAGGSGVAADRGREERS
jgi:hypothetical protein